jgi:hypothetical protein
VHCQKQACDILFSTTTGDVTDVYISILCAPITPTTSRYVGRGMGEFERSCVIGGCIVDVPHCHACADNTTCALCRDAQYLLNGECVASCPAGYVGRGSGDFRRVCEALNSTSLSIAAASGVTPCIDQQNHCHVCASATVCDFCRDAHYLFNGTCVSSCPAGYIPQGSGNYRRRCALDDTLMCVNGTLEGTASTACSCPSNCHACQMVRALVVPINVSLHSCSLQRVR